MPNTDNTDHPILSENRHDSIVQTAFDIRDILTAQNQPVTSVEFSTWDGTVTLTNAQARSLIALARKGVSA